MVQAGLALTWPVGDPVGVGNAKKSRDQQLRAAEEDEKRVRAALVERVAGSLMKAGKDAQAANRLWLYQNLVKPVSEVLSRSKVGDSNTERAPDKNEAIDGAPEITHAEDFTWLRVNKEVYRFKKGQQANAIKHLYEAWEQSGQTDGCGLSEDAIAERIGAAASFRMAKLFSKHSVMKSILARAEKGVWALFLQNPRRMDSSEDR